MTNVQSGSYRAAPLVRRRGVLLGLTAAYLRRLATALGLTFPSFSRGSAFADTVDAGHCDQPLDGTPPLATQRRARLARALNSGFGVQYWGEAFTADRLAAAPHGAFIIETAKIGANAVGKSREVFFSAEEIRQIGHDGRRPVLGYLNLAKVEPYRDYWVDAVASTTGHDTLVQGDAPWIGPSLGKDGTLAQFWTPEWEAILVDRVDRLLSQGVDGLFLDDVLQYYAYYTAVLAGRPGFAVSGGPATAVDFAQAMMKLVLTIASRARLQDCGALIVVNNGAHIGGDAGEDPPNSQRRDTFDRYRAVLDGILIESVFASGGNATAISVLQDEYASEGIPVLTIEFADATKNVPSAESISIIARRAASEGFALYVADDATFSHLVPPIPLVQAAPVLP